MATAKKAKNRKLYEKKRKKKIIVFSLLFFQLCFRLCRGKWLPKLCNNKYRIYESKLAICCEHDVNDANGKCAVY